MTSIEVRNPLTGQIDHHLRPLTEAEVTATVDRLRGAAPGWRRSDRRKPLAEFGAAVAADEELLAALIADTGRTVESRLEQQIVRGLIDRWIRDAPDALRPPEEMGAAQPGIVIAGEAVPYDVVGVISPWNFPLLLSLIDAIPALAAGCTVVVKPSEVAPRFIEPLSRLIPAGLPLTIIPGGAETGAALVPKVDALVFTGGVPSGRAVAEAAARAFIPAFFELGGKDPAIVLAGSDLDRAAHAILWGGTANAGQSCQSIERVYVESAVHDEFVELLADRAGKVGLTVEGGPVGPFIAAGQADVVAEHLADARRLGARVHTGGRIEHHGGGLWCRPTVLSGVDHTMKVMTEETFGPVLPVMAVADVEEAVRLANDSGYGLSAAVFGPDERAARAVAGRLEVGAVSINDASLTALVHEGEKHSFKLSGLGGSRMGKASIQRFVRRRAHLINRSSEPDPWWHR
ncbi:aldehyde dehydrogenase family protein [Nonomuraea longicatena]|uniref:Aldehyde dehydrogenase family protein n=1 Tax=Nonomuraea longicatena TaxID=83682 RepID=A0ABP4A0Z8_9ACTN